MGRRRKPKAYRNISTLPPMLTIDELAEVLRIGLNVAYREVRAGRVPGAQKIGGSWRVHRDSVKEWMASGGSGGGVDGEG